jgi:Na+-driven multidrug efflux pump
VGLFTPDVSVIEIGSSTLAVAALLQLLNAVYNHFKGVLRGRSVFRVVAYVTTGCAWVITPPFTYLIGVRAGWGAPGALAVLCVEVTLGLLLLGAKVRTSTRALTDEYP